MLDQLDSFNEAMKNSRDVTNHLMDETIHSLKHSLEDYAKRKLIILEDLEDVDTVKEEASNKKKLESGIREEMELMNQLKYVKEQLKNSENRKLI